MSAGRAEGRDWACIAHPPSKKGRDAQPYLYDCCDSTMAASSHLDGFFIVFFNGWTGSDGQNRVCVTLVSHDATFVQ